MKLSGLSDSKSTYVIAIALFSGAVFAYSYNLEGQPWHGDEVTYLGWGANYVHLVAKGDFGNPCLVSLDKCNDLFHIPAFGLTYSPIRNLMVGIPMYLAGQDSGNFYNWSCYWDCYKSHEGPTIAEMTAGRLLSPILGSLGVVLAFLVGKSLFNRTYGILASVLFLFYDLWVWYSREIMVEIHYVFFALLSVFLLLCSLRDGRVKTTYFVASALVFGLSLNSKLLAVCFSGLFFAIMLTRFLSTTVSGKPGRKKVGRAGLLLVSFFALGLVGMFLAQPGFYQNPVAEIKLVKSDMDNYNRDVWYIGYPTGQNLQPKSIGALLHFAVFPNFIETQIAKPSDSLSGNYGWTYPPTYSTIPMSVLFFAGLGFLAYRISRTRRLFSSELVLIIWIASTLVFTLVIVKDFSLERYLLPLELSMIFISAYGAWGFAAGISNNKLRLGFLSFFLLVHSLTSLSYYDKIYFSPGTTWVNPLHYGTLQDSMDNPYVFAANVSFILVFAFIAASRFLRRNAEKPDINSTARQDLKR
ncbi:MAG TPA: glycosyltransferase family 39 protein [Candidatus Nitrosotalea sp.]|nr:glycosyltransferase family 39 protein [Candidatus Nitrosotalea sp.]